MVDNMNTKTGVLSGTVEIKKSDGTTVTWYLKSRDNSKEKLGEKQNGNTTTSNVSTKHDR